MHIIFERRDNMKKQVTALLAAVVMAFGAVPVSEGILPEGIKTNISASALETEYPTPGQVFYFHSYPDYTWIDLTWGSVSFADGYRVYMYDEAAKKYNKIATLKDAQTEYRVKGLKNGKKYKFKVRAYIIDNGKTYWGKSSCVETVSTIPYVPEKIKDVYARPASTTAGVLTWAKVEKAKGYRIYIYDSKTKKYKKLKTVTGENNKTYELKGLKAGKTYKYKVRAYRKIGKKTYWGKPSAAVTLTTLTKGHKNDCYYGLSYDKQAQADKIAKKAAEKIMKNSKYKTDLDRVRAATKYVYNKLNGEKYGFDENNYYCTPYGVLVAKVFTCAGTATTLGRILDYMGYEWYHVNENQYLHQWCILVMDGKVGYACGMAGLAGYGDLRDEEDVWFEG